MLGALILDSTTDAEGQPRDGVDVALVYSDPWPGQSLANALTFTYWCGEDSVVSYLDWVNPLETVALAGDIGRWMGRELDKELIGYIVTLQNSGGAPSVSFTLGVNGELISVAIWNGGSDPNVLSAEEYFAALEAMASAAEEDGGTEEAARSSEDSCK